LGGGATRAAPNDRTQLCNRAGRRLRAFGVSRGNKYERNGTWEGEKKPRGPVKMGIRSGQGRKRTRGENDAPINLQVN